MIERVRGTLLALGPEHAVIETGGVGLQIAASSSTLLSLPRVGDEVVLRTYLVVREDALLLYGFGSEAERELFLLLLTVQKVGPKLALAVLSGGDAGQIGAAIASGDAKRLEATPGVGKRTAERIVVELKDKVAPVTVAASAKGGPSALGAAAVDSSPALLARRALEGLGFGDAELDAMLTDAEGETVEDIVASALRQSRR